MNSYGLVAVFSLLVVFWSSRVSAAEQPLQPSSVSPRGLESRVHPILGCLKRTDIGPCLQKSVFGFLEDWLVNGEDANGLDRSDEDFASMHPYLAKVVNGLADGIAVWNSGGVDAQEDEEDDDVATRDSKTSTDLLDIPQEATRGHHKKEKRKQKKQRLTKIATHIILLILYFVKSQLFYMGDHVIRTGIFAGFALVAKVFIIIKFIELKRYLWLIKEDKKEYFHHEVSHHDHHYDHDDHYNHHDSGWLGSWSNGWPWSGRSSQSSAPPAQEYSHRLAYSAASPVYHHSPQNTTNVL